jgi:hypothetical protein
MLPELTTERLLLREIRLADGDAINWSKELAHANVTTIEFDNMGANLG